MILLQQQDYSSEPQFVTKSLYSLYFKTFIENKTTEIFQLTKNIPCPGTKGLENWGTIERGVNVGRMFFMFDS